MLELYNKFIGGYSKLIRQILQPFIFHIILFKPQGSDPLRQINRPLKSLEYHCSKLDVCEIIGFLQSGST